MIIHSYYVVVSMINVAESVYYLLLDEQGWGLTVMMGIHPTPRLLPVHPMELYYRRLAASVFGGFKGKSQLPDLVEKCMHGVSACRDDLL